MKVVSLFSGIGGFDLGFERAGMDVVGVCEINKHAQTVLQRRFPSATLHTDVRSVHYERGSVDLICGGFPCQDLSVAGKRRGLDGERSGLWFEFARIIDETEPAWVVIENVPGLFSSARGADFAVIIQWLAQRGYGVGWRVLDAQGFGIAQRRKRVFIVASFGSPRGCTVLLEPESLQGDYQPRRKTGQDDTGTVAKCLTAHGQRGDWETENMISIGHPDVSPTLRAEAKGSIMSGSGDINAPLAISINGNHLQWDISIEQTHTLVTNRPEQVLWEMCHTDNPTRICPDQETSPTLVSRMGTGGNQVPLIGVRRLTPTECERLQGFPDGWTDGQSDTQRYKQLGNAVAVPVAEWIGRRIMEASNATTK